MIYNAFPTTTGEGEEGSINGTAEVPFKEIVLKGNTSQESYSGIQDTGGNPAPNPDYPYPVNVVTGDNEVIVSNEDNTQSQTYPINLGSMELCKIGDYQDSIKKSSGKNLAEEKISNANVYSNGKFLTGDYDIYIAKIEQNKTYTVSTNDSQFNAGFFTTKPEIGSTTYDNSRVVQTSKTFTAPITGYIAFRTNSGYQFAMINEGSTALPYEPYGKVWYKYGAIGKHTITDSDVSLINTYWVDNYGVYAAGILKSKFNLSSILTDKRSLCNVSRKINGQLKEENTYTFNNNANYVFFFNSAFDTIEHANAKLVGAVVYYNFDTPTITEITDTTLIEQLDNLEKAYSYDTQTNISQTNQDKPFIISYEAILSLRNVLNDLEKES